MNKKLLSVALAVIAFIAISSFLPPEIYSSSLWIIFWTAIAIFLVFCICIRKLWKQPVLFAIHLSLILMIIGAGFTFFTGQRGSVHLIPDHPTATFTLSTGEEALLPDTLTLKRFQTLHYPGMTFPNDFRSDISTSKHGDISVSINNIAQIDSYRFMQQSFDKEGSSILMVTHDPLGIFFTYSGYILFFLADGTWILLRLLRHKIRVAFLLLLFLVCGYPLCNAASAIPAEVAQETSCRQGICNGRISSFALCARDFSLKITGSDSPASLSPEQFTLSIAAYPEEWRNVPFIKIRNRNLASALGITSDYISPSQLYDSSGKYKPASLYREGIGSLDNAILQLDEKVALVASVMKGDYFQPIPKNDKLARSESDIKSEVLYTRIQPVRIFFIAAFIIAITALFPNPLVKRIAKFSVFSLSLFGVISIIWLALILKHSPLVSTPHLMQFTAVCIILITSILSLRHESLLSSGSLIAGCLSLVAWIALKNPVLTPLMPVLNSFWLTIHVSIVMIAYSLLGFTFPVAITALLFSRKSSGFYKLIYNLDLIGVFLLGVGIFTGAMWANVSWGRYWAWDPKETWALVTMLIYALPLHKSFGFHRSPKSIYIFSTFAILSIIMTYYGVNFLSSVHAYK